MSKIWRIFRYPENLIDLKRNFSLQKTTNNTQYTSKNSRHSILLRLLSCSISSQKVHQIHELQSFQLIHKQTIQWLIVYWVVKLWKVKKRGPSEYISVQSIPSILQTDQLQYFLGIYLLHLARHSWKVILGKIEALSLKLWID